MANEHIQVKNRQTDPHHHVIGRLYRAYSYKHDQMAVYYCDSWVENTGYWMTNIEHPKDRKNVSERAIDRTYHQVRDTGESYTFLWRVWAKNVEPLLPLDPFQREYS